MLFEIANTYRFPFPVQQNVPVALMKRTTISRIFLNMLRGNKSGSATTALIKRKESKQLKDHIFSHLIFAICVCVLIIMIIISKYVWMSYGTKRSLSFFFFFYQRIKRERGSVKNNVRVCSEYFFGWGSVIEISSYMALC